MRRSLLMAAVAAAAVAVPSPAAAAPRVEIEPGPQIAPDQDITIKASGLRPRARYSVRASLIGDAPGDCQFTAFPAPNPVRATRSGRLSAAMTIDEWTGPWCAGRTYRVTVKKARSLRTVASTRFTVTG